MPIVRLDDHQDQAGAWDVMAAVHGITAFNVGANIGQAARVLAPNFHRVIALEPCQESFDILLVESAPNVVPLLMAASDHSGEIELTETERSIRTGQLTTGEGLAWGRAVGTRRVEATTLDDLIVHYGHPDFVSIDTEGHEIKVLEGWSTPRCDALIEVHRAEHEAVIRSLWEGPLRTLRHAPSVGRNAYENHMWLTTIGA